MGDDLREVFELHIKEGRTAEDIAEIFDRDVSYINEKIKEYRLLKRDNDIDPKIKKGIEILKKAKTDTTSYFGQQYDVWIKNIEPIDPTIIIPKGSVYGDIAFDYVDKDIALGVVTYPNKVEYMGREVKEGKKRTAILGREVPKWMGVYDIEPFPYVLYCDKLGNKGLIRLDQRHDLFQYSFIDTTKTIPIAGKDKILAEKGNIKKNHPIILKKIMIDKDIYNKNIADLTTAPLMAYTFHESHRITSKDIFDDFREKIDYHIDVEEWVKTLLAYWSIGTYFYQIFRAYPYLWCYALRGSGKTRVLNTLSCLCKNGMFISNTTLSAMVRTANAYHPTQALDQLEKLAKKKNEYPEFISALCSSYKKGGKYHYSEQKNKNWIPMALDIYCPKVLASTEEIDHTLLSRAIPIPVKRSMQSKKYEPRQPDQMELKPLRHRAIVFSINTGARLFNDYIKGNFTLYDNLLPETIPRVREILNPILVMAEFLEIGDDEIEKGHIEKIAEYVSECAKSESVDEADDRIICGCYYLVIRERDGKYKVQQIIDSLDLKNDAEIDYYNNKRVGKRLTRLFGKPTRLGGYPYYKLELEDIIDKLKRYDIEKGIPEESERPQKTID